MLGKESRLLQTSVWTWGQSQSRPPSSPSALSCDKQAASCNAHREHSAAEGQIGGTEWTPPYSYLGGHLDLVAPHLMKGTMNSLTWSFKVPVLSVSPFGMLSASFPTHSLSSPWMVTMRLTLSLLAEVSPAAHTHMHKCMHAHTFRSFASLACRYDAREKSSFATTNWSTYTAAHTTGVKTKASRLRRKQPIVSWAFSMHLHYLCRNTSP